jgi:hypothetical protein
MPTINQTIQKINNFALLPAGWHYGEGEAPDSQLIEDAENFLRLAEGWGISEANAFPGIDGQIEITLYVKEKTFAFMFDIDNTFSITEEVKGKIVSDIYEQPYRVAEDKLWDISQENQIISDSSISDIGTQETKDLELPVSSVPQRKETRLEVSRLFRLNASKTVNSQFVSIYHTFTAPSSATQPFFCH